MPLRVCLIHFFDPRGSKLSGVETYARDFIRYHPQDAEVLIVGVDSSGTLRLGEIAELELDGRKFKFFPVVFWPDHTISQHATRLTDSLTVHGTLGLLRFLPRLRKILRAGNYSIDCSRVELGFICRALGVPYFPMMHDEGTHVQRGNLVNRYMWLYRLLEVITVRSCTEFFCVSEQITERMKSTYLDQAAKFSTVFTWFDDRIIAPTPFDVEDGVFRICFFGRLDIVKNPALMFEAIALVKAKVPVEFHYAGAWDPEVYPEFASIRDISILHGFLRMDKIAALLKRMHCGILTSNMEGFPRSVVECLGAGRPVVTVYLPQLADLFSTPAAGAIVAHEATRKETAVRIADSLLHLWREIQSGNRQPRDAAETVAQYTPQFQLGKVFAHHRSVHAET